MIFLHFLVFKVKDNERAKLERSYFFIILIFNSGLQMNLQTQSLFNAHSLQIINVSIKITKKTHFAGIC